MEVTIGGNRVGSGKKMQAHLHNYNRSTHNLSETFASSMTCGVLYPALCKLAMRGDSFDISINADCRTIPTVGPLFGSFKMQVDVYQCPIRLYQGILHNNPLAIGLKMQQVKFPLLEVWSKDNADHSSMKMNTSSLLHYLGFSGLGRSSVENGGAGRKINALPVLSYYDIFKTYYANKQEEKAYVIGVANNNKEYGIKNAKLVTWDQTPIELDEDLDKNIAPASAFLIDINWDESDLWADETNREEIICTITGDGDQPTELNYNILEIYANSTDITDQYIKSVQFKKKTKQITRNGEPIIRDGVPMTIEVTTGVVIECFNASTILKAFNISVNKITKEYTIDEKLQLIQFNLSTIDDMRYDLLSHHTLGSAYTITDVSAYLPYSILTNSTQDEVTYNNFPLNGLVLKTYQNDIFNNWLNTEWIEGENSISELTKVAIVDGAFSMDSLNFAQKQYNMLNRIAVAGATYEDWQDVVYEEVKRRQIESPLFVGGMSQDVVFDEIIQNAPANVDGVTSQLGDLGGRGKLLGNKKGGKIHVKCDEACFIIAIVSLTPRLYYTQGNEFYMTDVLSLDDMHKPPMDGIGFQDLIGERMAWFDTQITNNTTTVAHRSKIGKLPAWIEYMTSYDRAHGDFAEDAAGYMILSRRYEMANDGTIKDATTYVDPTKFNYAFAYKNLDSQNFWVQVGFNIKARRLMSARLIPNV